MEEGDILGSVCNIPTTDLDLEDFDFGIFLTEQVSETTKPSVGMQQNRAPPFPAETKRPSNDAIQPRTKRTRIQHSHICDVHQPSSLKPVARCFGKRSRMSRYKGTRCERIVATFTDGQLPVCAQHQAQVMRMMRCEAILECGISCNEISPWTPHGYVLCEAHLSTGKCYFMELPVEIRIIIYQHFIPDLPVPARWSATRSLRQDRTHISTAIFRVNKTVHEEVADLFYGQTTFEIDVSNEWESNAATTPSILMCYAKDEKDSRLTAGTAASRITPWRPTRPTRQRISAAGIKHNLNPWLPSLSLQYFQKIRSFRINIVFDTPKAPPSSNNSSQASEKILAEAERNLLCDYLYRVVDRLVTSTQPCLQNLDISVRIQGILNEDDAQANFKAITHCQALMNPIRRLRSRTASIVTLIRIGKGNREIHLLSVYPKEEDSIKKFVQSCCAELTGSLVPPSRSPVLVLFCQLAELVSQMGQHPFWRDTDIEEMEILLSSGRSAREAHDMKAMKSLFVDVFNKLTKYNSDHLDFMKQMKQSCERVRSSGKEQRDESTPVF